MPWNTLLQVFGVLAVGIIAALITLVGTLVATANQRKISAAQLGAQQQGNAILGLTNLADARGDEMDRQSKRIAQLETALHDSQTEAAALKSQLQAAQDQTIKLQARMFDMQEKYDADRRESLATIRMLEQRIVQLENMRITRPRAPRKAAPES